tara:strand:- start:29 stop:493 length:465 start_codon:yes stop_codon:yes gene_type:complete
MQWDTLAFSELSTTWLYAVLRLRQQVFVVEQQCAYLDLDDRDQGALHMLCKRGSALLAYQRCLPPGLSYPESSLGRIVVCPDMRGQRLGEELVQRGIEHNLARWPKHDLCISAQAHLQAFYSSLGFVAEGGEYLEDNIVHRQMRYRSIKKQPGL